MAGMRRSLGFLALSLLTSAHAFYLPGAAPHDYVSGERVELFVNALTPMIAGHDDAKLVCSPLMLIYAGTLSLAILGFRNPS